MEASRTTKSSSTTAWYLLDELQVSISQRHLQPYSQQLNYEKNEAMLSAGKWMQPEMSRLNESGSVRKANTNVFSHL